MKCVAFLLAALVATVSGHTTALCTATMKSQPAMLTVLGGTYHGYSEGMGACQVVMGNIAATVTSSPFPNGWVSNGVGGGNCPCTIADATATSTAGNSIRSCCGGAQIRSGPSGWRYVASDAVLSCYQHDTSATVAGSEVWLRPRASSTKFSCYPSATQSFHMAYLLNQVAGTFSFRWANPNAVLAQLGSEKPCSTIQSYPHYLKVDVSDGGIPCVGPPQASNVPGPIAGVPGVSQSKLNVCSNAASGSLCNPTCDDGAATQIGTIKCAKRGTDANPLPSVWDITMKCTKLKLCQMPPKGAFAPIGAKGPVGISGPGCAFFSESGAMCDYLCDSGHGHTSNYKLLCGTPGAGQTYGSWTLVTGNSGNPLCAASKAPTLTPKPTNHPTTKRPTKLPTKSPTSTASPTKYPTLSPTTKGPTWAPTKLPTFAPTVLPITMQHLVDITAPAGAPTPYSLTQAQINAAIADYAAATGVPVGSISAYYIGEGSTGQLVFTVKVANDVMKEGVEMATITLPSLTANGGPTIVVQAVTSSTGPTVTLTVELKGQDPNTWVQGAWAEQYCSSVGIHPAQCNISPATINGVLTITVTTTVVDSSAAQALQQRAQQIAQLPAPTKRTLFPSRAPTPPTRAGHIPPPPTMPPSNPPTPKPLVVTQSTSGVVKYDNKATFEITVSGDSGTVFDAGTFTAKYAAVAGVDPSTVEAVAVPASDGSGFQVSVNVYSKDVTALASVTSKTTAAGMKIPGFTLEKVQTVDNSLFEETKIIFTVANTSATQVFDADVFLNKYCQLKLSLPSAAEYQISVKKNNDGSFEVTVSPKITMPVSLRQAAAARIISNRAVGELVQGTPSMPYYIPGYTIREAHSKKGKEDTLAKEKALGANKFEEEFDGVMIVSEFPTAGSLKNFAIAMMTLMWVVYAAVTLFFANGADKKAKKYVAAGRDSPNPSFMSDFIYTSVFNRNPYSNFNSKERMLTILTFMILCVASIAYRFVKSMKDIPSLALFVFAAWVPAKVLEVIFRKAVRPPAKKKLNKFGFETDADVPRPPSAMKRAKPNRAAPPPPPADEPMTTDLEAEAEVLPPPPGPPKPRVPKPSSRSESPLNTPQDEEQPMTERPGTSSPRAWHDDDDDFDDFHREAAKEGKKLPAGCRMFGFVLFGVVAFMAIFFCWWIMRFTVLLAGKDAGIDLGIMMLGSACVLDLLLAMYMVKNAASAPSKDVPMDDFEVGSRRGSTNSMFESGSRRTSVEVR